MKALSSSALILVAALFLLPTLARAQQKKTPAPARSPHLVRTTIKHDQHRFAYGGTLSVVGAPDGSITIEGWPRSEIDISAEIQLRADSEVDLDRLAALNGFIVDEDSNHVQVLSTGTHDKEFMRRVAKKFPKTLLGLPWKIDYRIRVPLSTDLEVNAGRGPISISGIEGNIRLSATESETNLKLSGGTLVATIAIGKLNLSIPVRSWRGVGGDIRIAAGELTVELPPAFDGVLDAEILRSGQITDSYGGLQPRESRGFTPQKLKARAGAGGAFFQFTVGDGTITIRKQSADGKQ